MIHYSKLIAFEWRKVLLWKTIIVLHSPEMTRLMLGNGNMHYSFVFNYHSFAYLLSSLGQGPLNYTF